MQLASKALQLQKLFLYVEYDLMRLHAGLGSMCFERQLNSAHSDRQASCSGTGRSVSARYARLAIFHSPKKLTCFRKNNLFLLFFIVLLISENFNKLTRQKSDVVRLFLIKSPPAKKDCKSLPNWSGSFRAIWARRLLIVAERPPRRYSVVPSRYA